MSKPLTTSALFARRECEAHLSINTTILLSLDKNDKARCKQDALKSVPVPLASVLFIKRIVIWLILPVVIRLSQRLSHACLSISNYTVKLRMAHYISYSLFDSTLLLG